MSEQIKVCLVQYIFNKAFYVPASNLENTLSSFTNLTVINGILENLELDNENVKKIEVGHKTSNNFFLAVFRYLYLQLRMIVTIFKISDDFDILILFMEQGDVLYALLGKLLRKKVYWHLPSDSKKSAYFINKHRLIATISDQFQKLNFIFVDRIVLYSPNLIKEWNIGKYKEKIVFAHAHFMDLNRFTIKKKIEERDAIIGYFGRLSHEKGIINFVKSIRMVPKNLKLKYIIIGVGDLKDSVLEYINNNKLNNVKVMGWVDDSEIPDYLNEFKLVVLPSYTEGFPFTMLESIACGTPVLATPVGAIPDILIDGVTGFIMRDNDPETISENLVRVLQYPTIDNVVNKSYNLVKNEFNLEQAVKKWENILENDR